MAAPKPTVVFSPAFSTILTACGIDQSIQQLDTALDHTEQDVKFKRKHGMSRKDWDTALSLHLHGDLQ
jgi:hypothetical protein